MRKTLVSPLKAVWYRSWTIAWGYAQAVSGAVLLSLSQLNTYVSDPTFKTYLEEFDVPKTVTITLAILGIITWLAHGRSED